MHGRRDLHTDEEGLPQRDARHRIHRQRDEPDSAALTGIGIITQPPPPGLTQLPGDEGCLTFDGREVAADATTAGRCKAAPGIGRLNNGWQSSPDNVLLSPDSKHVYTTSYNAFDAKWNAMVGLSRDAISGCGRQRGCRTRPVIAGCSALADEEMPLNMAISPDGKSLYAGSSAWAAPGGRVRAAMTETPPPAR